MLSKPTGRLALCGVMAALMTALMLLGAMIPLSTYSCPALAGILSIPIIWEYGSPTGGILYAAVAILSLILCPDKEAALLFALLLGWYPVLRPRVQHIRTKALRAAVKLLLFNLSILAIYSLLLFVFPLPELVEESAGWSGLFLAGLLVLGNVTFFLYDLVLDRMTGFYVYRLRPRLMSKGH